MLSQPGKQIITIDILPNISQSKGNQIIKFGQLIECNKRNFGHYVYSNCFVPRVASQKFEIKTFNYKRDK